MQRQGLRSEHKSKGKNQEERRCRIGATAPPNRSKTLPPGNAAVPAGRTRDAGINPDIIHSFD